MMASMMKGQHQTKRLLSSLVQGSFLAGHKRTVSQAVHQQAAIQSSTDTFMFGHGLILVIRACEAASCFVLHQYNPIALQYSEGEFCVSLSMLAAMSGLHTKGLAAGFSCHQRQ